MDLTKVLDELDNALDLMICVSEASSEKHIQTTAGMAAATIVEVKNQLSEMSK